MGEAAFDQLPSPAQQLFPMLDTNPPPVALHLMPRFRFVLPMTPHTQAKGCPSQRSPATGRRAVTAVTAR